MSQPNSPIRSVYRFAPLGVSAGFLTHALVQQQTTAALYSLLSMIGTGLWAAGIAYVESFLAELKVILSSAGQQHPHHLVAWISTQTTRLSWHLSGFDGKYLTCQANDCRRDKTEGLERILPSLLKPDLKDVYVPLRIDERLNARWQGRTIPGLRNADDETPTGRRTKPKPCEIWDFLQRLPQEPALRRMAIIADGGSGKTTLVRHIAYAYATHSQRRSAPKLIPVLILLRELRTRIADHALPDLPTLITEFHLPKLPKDYDLTPPPNWATNLLQRKDPSALVLLDGFDEVEEPQRSGVSEWISQQMHDYPNAVFILTSRPTAYDEGYSADRPDVPLQVNALEKEERNLFIRKWYDTQEKVYARAFTPDVRAEATTRAENLIQQLDQRRELANMATNPLLLKLITNLHRNNSGDQLPAYEVEIYGGICKLQLEDRPKARGIIMELYGNQRQAVLQTLALAMVQANQAQISRDDLLAVITPKLNVLDQTAFPQTFLKQMVQVSELLNLRDTDYEFAHLNFRDYLAAVEVAQTQQEHLLIQNFLEEHWRKTILLYAGQHRVDALMRHALNLGSVDALRLGYACWRQCPTKGAKDSQALATTLRCSTQYLERFLQQGEWEEADRETYRLMVQAVGKEWDDWLYAEELLNFPCEPLLAIDRLWVTYSNGQFGFSVQKEIYTSPHIGGIPDGKFREKSWDLFCKEVRWQDEEGNYIFQKVTYDTSAPKGHLPGSGGGGVGGGEFSSLASRLVKCSQ